MGGWGGRGVKAFVDAAAKIQVFIWPVLPNEAQEPLLSYIQTLLEGGREELFILHLSSLNMRIRRHADVINITMQGLDLFIYICILRFLCSYITSQDPVFLLNAVGKLSKYVFDSGPKCLKAKRYNFLFRIF